METANREDSFVFSEAGRLQLMQDLVLEKLFRHSAKELPEHLLRLLNCTGIEFSGAWFAVLVVRVFVLPLEGQFLTSGPADIHLEDFDRVGIIVREAMTEHLSDLGQVWVVNMGDGPPCLLNLPILNDLSKEEKERIIRRISEHARDAADTIWKKHEIKVTIAISDLWNGISEISNAFQQAYDLSLYAMTAENADEPVFAYSVYHQQDIFSASLSGAELRFCDAVAGGEWDEAEALLWDLARTDLLRDINSHNLLTYLLRRRIHSALSAIFPPLTPEIKSAVMDDVSVRIREYQRSKRDGVGELEDVLNLVSDLMQCMRSGVSNQYTDKEQAIQEAIDYINDQFAESNLTVGLVSRRFGFSNPRFTKAFRHKTGLNPLDYLHQCRISAAKQKLTGTDLSLSQIAVSVGYISSRALIQAFKHYEGMTPGRYREEYGIKKREGRHSSIDW